MSATQKSPRGLALHPVLNQAPPCFHNTSFLWLNSSFEEPRKKSSFSATDGEPRRDVRATLPRMSDCRPQPMP
jgi:hypothetical protein